MIPASFVEPDGAIMYRTPLYNQMTNFSKKQSNVMICKTVWIQKHMVFLASEVHSAD